MKYIHALFSSLFILSSLTLPLQSTAAELQQLFLLAERGDIQAQSQLAYMYYVGETVEKDYVEAVRWYGAAAAQGDREAQYHLGLAHAYGEGARKDVTLSASWYQQAAKQGHTNAQHNLGLAYLNGDGVPQNVQIAQQWFEQAANQGYTRAQTQLANLYQSGEGIPQNDQIAANWYRQAADRGDPTAQYQLAKLYRSGHGLEQDTSQAKRWFRMSADQGYTPAENELALMNTKPDPQPNQTAETHGANHINSNKQLAKNEGSGISSFFKQVFNIEDNQKEVSNSEQSSSSPLAEINSPTKSLQPPPITAGTSSYQYSVETAANETVQTSNQTINEENLIRNNIESSSLYQKAAQGDKEAQFHLAKIYYQGDKVERDYEQAFLWFRRSAQQDHVEAQYAMGNVYLMGEGVNQNDQEALRWYALAADQGHKAALHNYDNLTKLRSPINAEDDLNLEDTDPTRVFASSSKPRQWSDSEMIINTHRQNNTLQTPNKPNKKEPGLFKSLTNAFGFASKENEIEKNKQQGVFSETEQNQIVTNETKALDEEIIYATMLDETETMPLNTTNSFTQDVSAENLYQQGLAYHYGHGLAKNYQEAFEYFASAANTGHVQAQYRVAYAYAYGEGVAKDEAFAASWYQKAALQGEPLAQRQLAKMYWAGKGINKDKAKAHAWYKIIARKGTSLDMQRLEQIRQNISPEDVNRSTQILAKLNAQLAKL